MKHQRSKGVLSASKLKAQHDRVAKIRERESKKRVAKDKALQKSRDKDAPLMSNPSRKQSRSVRSNSVQIVTTHKR